MRQKLSRFFAGRNGMDNLSILATALALLLLVAAGFCRGPASLILWALSVLVLGYGYFRILSKNVAKRMRENNWYLQRTRGIRNALRSRLERFRQRKTYKFYKCPSCKTLLRVPRGKGKIQITCRKCGNRFAKKT